MHIKILYQNPLEHTESIFSCHCNLSSLIQSLCLEYTRPGQNNFTSLQHFPSIFSYFTSSCLAQAAKQATAARFIFSPNRLRLPFNAWFSTEWALWNVHHTNTVETNYGPLSAWSCLSYRHACSPSILIISALWFSSSGRW